MVTGTVHAPAENPPATNEAAERAAIAERFAAALVATKELAGRIREAASVPITTPEQREALYGLSKEGQELGKKIEKVRKSLVDPLNAMVKFINDIAKKQLMEAVDEGIALAKVGMKAFDDEQESQQEAKRQALEQERIKREAAEQAERDKIAQETADAAAAAKEEAEKYRAEVIDPMPPGPEKASALRAWREKWDAENLHIEEEGARRAAVQELVGRAEHGDLASSETALDAEVGRGITKRWVFEVVDIGKLYAARPDLVKAEPRTALINQEIAAGVREIDGILIKQESSVSLR